jgi:hypothetical protein
MAYLQSIQLPLPKCAYREPEYLHYLTQYLTCATFLETQSEARDAIAD